MPHALNDPGEENKDDDERSENHAAGDGHYPGGFRVDPGDVGGVLCGDMFPTRDCHGVFPVNWHSRGIAWYDLTDAAPVVTSTGNPPQGNQLDGIDLLDNGLFVFPVRGKQLGFIDPKSPGAPKMVEVEGLVAGTPIRGIPTVCGDLVAFASRRDGGVVTLDLSEPGNPVVLRERCYHLSQGNCDRVAFHKGKIIIPAGHYGLFMEK